MGIVYTYDAVVSKDDVTLTLAGQLDLPAGRKQWQLYASLRKQGCKNEEYILFTALIGTSPKQTPFTKAVTQLRQAVAKYLGCEVTQLAIKPGAWQKR